MDKKYQEACSYLKRYRFYKSIIEQPFIDSMGLGKSRRWKQIEVWCDQVSGAVSAITDPGQAKLIRDEFIVPGGSRTLAQAQLGLKKSQYYKVRKRAVLEWWELVNREGN